VDTVVIVFVAVVDVNSSTDLVSVMFNISAQNDQVIDLLATTFG
jgi:hypothetical protein